MVSGFSVLGFALLAVTVAVTYWGWRSFPPQDTPPNVPAAPTFVLDVHPTSTMPSAWQVRTNLIEDGGRSWWVVSFGPAGGAATSYTYSLLAYGLPTLGDRCGLQDTARTHCFAQQNPPGSFRRRPILTLGEQAERQLFSGEHGLLFPAPDAPSFPGGGKVSVVEGSGAGSPVVLPFRLEQDSIPFIHSGSFVSFSLAPVVINVSSPNGRPFTTSAVFDTEVGASELRTLQLTAAANAPSTILSDPAVNQRDQADPFLTSWLWAETDPLTGGPTIPGTAQSTPIDISSATDVATQQAETHGALFAGILFGIAGGAFVAAMQELFGGLRNFPRRWPRQKVPT